MAKASGTIDLKAQKDAHDDAAKKATNFLSADSSGVMVYDGTNGEQAPSNPGSTTRNVFIDQDSVDIREGKTVLASFGETVTIGRTTAPTSIQIGNNVFKLVENSDSSSIVEFIDYRGSDGSATFTSEFTGDDKTANYEMAFSEEGYSSLQVYLNDVLQTITTDYYLTHASLKPYYVNFKTVPSWGDSIKLVYTILNSKRAKAFSFGPRGSGNTGGLSFTQGINNVAAGHASSAIGYGCIANGVYAHAEGRSTRANGTGAHSEGTNNFANAEASHAEGDMNVVNKKAIDGHAEGYSNIVNGKYAHAEGHSTRANGDCSHAEGGEIPSTNSLGLYCKSDGDYSHAEGCGCEASGAYSHASGFGTNAYDSAQTAIGRFNMSDSRDAFVIGNGHGGQSTQPYNVEDAANIVRSNALSIDWNGNIISKAMVGEIKMHAKPITQYTSNGVVTTNAPEGWLLCDGAAVSRSTFEALFNVIGTTYGEGDGSTTFNLPNFCGRTPVGVGTSDATGATAHTLGQKDGEEAHTLKGDEAAQKAVSTGNMSAHASHYHRPSTVAELFLTTAANTDIGVNDTKRSWPSSSSSGQNFVYRISGSGGISERQYTETVSTEHTHNIAASDAANAHNNMQPYLGINFIINVGIYTSRN